MTDTPLMTMADIVRARAHDDAPALKADGRTWTYREWVQCCADRAARNLQLIWSPATRAA